MAAQRQEEWRKEVGEANYKRLTLHAKSVVDSVTSDYQDTDKTEEDRIAVLQKNIPLYSDYLNAVSEVSPERGAEAMKMLDDGKITPVEHQAFAELVNMSASEFMDASGDRSAQQFIDRDGNPVQGSMDKHGNYFDSSGAQRTDITPIAPGATQESIGLTGDKTVNRKIQEANHSARNLVDLTNRVSGQIDAIPQGGLGLTGKGVRGLDEVGAELAGIFEILGGVEEVDGRVVETGTLLDPDLYEWSGPMANASAAVKSNYITLAYLKAKTLDPGGRLAKDDVKLSMDSLGGDWASKGKMRAALNETKWQALNGLKNYYKSLNRPDAFPQDMQDMLNELEPSTFSDGIAEPTSEAEYNALPSGSQYRYTDGTIRTKP